MVAPPFEFATASRIVFGRGASGQAGTIVREFGRHALVVTGRKTSRADPIIEALRRHDVRVDTLAVGREPDVELVERGVALARETSCDVVVGIGGGSAIDAAKAIAILLTNPGDIFDYLEVVGKGGPLLETGLPCVALPTTAGTGSEVTRNAVLASPRHGVKASLRSPRMFPRVALIDPALTDALPPAVTAYTGLDALTQLIEAFVTSRAAPMTDALCRDGIPRAARALPRACRDGADQRARDDMACAATLSGIALSNAGLGAVHGFAGPIGGMFDAPHGAICAALLPHVMAANLRALRHRAADERTLLRFEEVARMLTGDAQATAEDGVSWLHGLCDELEIGGLGTFGVDATHVATLVERAGRASSMKANPVALGAEALTEILTAALSDRR